MIENISNALLSTFGGIITLFIIGLYIGRYLNSPAIFRLISIISSVGLILVLVYLKMQSSWFAQNPISAFILSAYGFTLALRCLELSCAYDWTYTRQMPLKLVLLYLLAFPKMPASVVKLSELPNRDVRREAVSSIVRGIIECIAFQLIFYIVPSEWFTQPSASFPLALRYLRYGLLSIVLYLAISFFVNYGFGVYTYLANIPMNPVFPSVPFISTSLRDFWSYRWNSLIKSSLHSISFVIIPKLVHPIIPMGNSVKGLLAFTLSGVIHEYALWFASNEWSGKHMLFFLSHGFFMFLELNMKFPARPRTLPGKVLGWLWTLGVFAITAPLFFDPMVERGLFSNIMNSNKIISYFVRSVENIIW